MRLKRTVAIAAAAGALAAITVPAMAFESEFHGTSRLRYFLSNYEQGFGGNPLTPDANGLISRTNLGGNAADTEKLKTNNYFEQRTRIFYTAKASDDLKLVTGFEIDSVFGDRAQSQTTGTAGTPGTGTLGQAATGRNQGGALESDTVNLETKWVYLDFKIPSTPVAVKAGIQPIKDQLKGIFLDADVAGIMTTTKAGPATMNVGYFRGYDQSYFSATKAASSSRGMVNLDIGLLEAKLALSKDINVGGVYYLYADGRGLSNLGATGAAGNIDTSSFMLHTLGLTADAKVGPLALSGFAAYQGGLYRNVTNAGLPPGTTIYSNALAFNAAAKIAVGPGTLKAAGLYTSGQGNLDRTHLTGWVGTSQSQNRAWSGGVGAAGTSTYNESGMMLLNRNAAAGTGTTDVALVYNTGNGTNPANMQGLWLATMGYDANITPKFYTNANVGAAWVARSNGLKPVDKATSKQNASNFMGTEVNLEAGYKMYDNLTASLQAAYVILGGYYTGAANLTGATVKDPENPYTVRTSLIFNF